MLLFIYALSNHVFVRGREVLDLSWIYHYMLPLAERFRSSGRAVWPLMYFIVALAIGALGRALNGWVKNPERVAAAILVVCATVQVVDLRISNRYDALRSYFFSVGADYYLPRLEDPRWKLMDDGGYRHMDAVPTALYGCTPEQLLAEGYLQRTNRVAVPRGVSGRPHVQYWVLLPPANGGRRELRSTERGGRESPRRRHGVQLHERQRAARRVDL